MMQLERKYITYFKCQHPQQVLSLINLNTYAEDRIYKATNLMRIVLFLC